MNLSVIIPNYNGKDLLENNLPKVFNAMSLYKNGKIEIIVVDDCSTDNSLILLEKLRLKIESLDSRIKFIIVKNKRNLGFSSSINEGAKNAMGEILILLNTDVVPEKYFLKYLLRHFEDKNIFAVGCMDKSIENGSVVLRGRGTGLWKKGFLIHSRGEVDSANTLWVNGGSGAFRKKIWDQLEGLDNIYSPFYWEDIDLSYRAVKSGYKILFEPKSTVIHEHEKGAIKKNFSKTQIEDIAYRNQFIFVWKNLTDMDLLIEHAFWLPYFFIKEFIRGNWRFFRGFFSAITLIPNIIQKRIKAKKLFVKKDREVVAAFI